MFGTLLTHEFKATGRTLGPLYGGFAALVLAACGMLWLTWQFGEVKVGLGTVKVETGTILGALSGVLTLVAVFAMMAIVIVTEVLIIMRFYRLLGDDGYFWFSLPVTPAQHMAVKLIAAMVWSVASLALFVGGIFAFVLVANGMEGGAALAELWAAVRTFPYMTPAFGFVALLVLAGLIAMAASCLQVQLACALGMQWPQSRLGASIGMYVLISVVLQILWTVATVGGGLFLFASTPHITTLTTLDAYRIPVMVVGIFCLLNLILCAVYFAAARWLLTKRLNLA